MGVLKLRDFSGGLNEVDKRSMLQINESPDCRNVVLDESGSIEKKPGYERVTDLGSEPITGLYVFNEKDGASHLIAVSSTKIYEIDPADGSTTELYSGVTAGEKFSFTTWQDTCYMSNGVEPVLEFDGSTVTENTSAPKGDYIVAHRNVLFIAGNRDNPSDVYYSDVGLIDADGDGSNWNNDDGSPQKIPVSTNDGDIITGITKQFSNLIIFKRNSIHTLYGSNPDNFQLKPTQPAVGCVAPRSIVNAYNQILFLSKDGAYAFDGSNVQIISRKVKKSIQDIYYPEEVSGALYDRKYLLSYPEGNTSYNNRVLVYDLDHQAWTKWTDMTASLFNNFDGAQDGNLAGELYFGDSEKGLVYKHDVAHYADVEEITGESFTSDYDNWIDLPHKNLKIDSEVVADGSYTRGTDYEMDYTEGRIKVLSSGSLADSTSYNIDYHKLRPINMYFETKDLDFDQPQYVKTIRKIWADSLTQGTFDLMYDIDSGQSSGSFTVDGRTTKDKYLWGAVTWDELVWHVPEDTNFEQGLEEQGVTAQLIFRDDSINANKIYGAAIKFRLKRER